MEHLGELSRGYYRSTSRLSELPANKRKAAIIEDAKNISWENIRYLDTILDMLRQRNIKAFLIRTPAHFCSVHENSENIFKDLLQNRFRSVEKLDFSKLPLNENEFSDCNHLNQNGAKRFSIWLDSLIKNGLFEKPDKQSFIDKYEYL